jgi:hypothetical protein
MAPLEQLDHVFHQINPRKSRDKPLEQQQAPALCKTSTAIVALRKSEFL